MRSFKTLSVLFFLSGACALVYEILWMRMAGLVFGNTLQATSTVLAAFMAGLTLGAWIGGRLADRQKNLIGLYALLELGIGLLALCSGVEFRAIELIYSQALHAASFSSSGVTLIRLLLSWAVILPPTLLIGATLPLLSRWISLEKIEFGKGIGALYAVNTWGAAAGTLLVSFALLRWFGVQGTLVATALVNALIALAAWSLGRSATPASAELQADAVSENSISDSELTPVSAVSKRSLLIISGLAGFTALAYEVVWTRVLTLVLGSSIYAFAIILAVFLAGIAGGGQLYGRWLSGRFDRRKLLAFSQAAIGIATWALLWAVPVVPFAYLLLFRLTGQSFYPFQIAQFLLAAAVIIVPALLFGITVPLVMHEYRGSGDRIAAGVGRAYASNTLGSILGSLAAGFVLIPFLGLEKSLAALAGVNVLASLVVACAGTSWRRSLNIGAAAAVTLGLVAGLRPRWDPNVINGAFRYAGQMDAAASPLDQWNDWRARSQRKEILFYEEGVHGTVMVRRDADSQAQSLLINGKPDASNYLGDMENQLLAGHLPALLRPQAANALVVGLGTGVTLGALTRHPLRLLDCVEIDRSVVRASRAFDAWSHRPLADSRVRLILNDARHHLLVSRLRYDLIISEPSNPSITGVANLFTRDFYQLVNARLQNNGLFCQWIQIYGMSPEAYAAAVKTFQSVFPHVSIWNSHLAGGDTLLIGSREPLVIDVERLSKEMTFPPVRDDLKQVGIDAPVQLLTKWVMGDKGVEHLAQGAALNTDDRPYLELRMPQLTQRTNSLRQNREWLLNQTETIAPYLTRFDQWQQLAQSYSEAGMPLAASATWERAISGSTERLEDYRAAARVHLQQRRYDAAIGLLQKALGRWPSSLGPRVDLLRIYLETGRRQDARSLLAKLVPEPKGRESWAAELSESSSRRGDRGPSAATYLRLGRLYAEIRERPAAAELMQKALDMDPNILSQMLSAGEPLGGAHGA